MKFHSTNSSEVKHLTRVSDALLCQMHVKRGRDTKIPQSSGPPIKVGDEVVHKELGDRIKRAATTASSLEAEQNSDSGPRCQDTILGDVDAQTRFETTSKQSNDPPLSRGYTLGSGEDSMKLLELMELCTQLSNKNRQSDLICYALTVNPIIYTSCIQQFWATTKANTINGERGTDCLPTAIIFEELAQMGYPTTLTIFNLVIKETIQAGQQRKDTAFSQEETQQDGQLS
ncbi:hypothetical protein Tco_1110113 [Tanacetum coccineum]|uniref:Uncharacterized protein n=1 Tax=Tanacetum coccineum TaxID=301880 RepID=A0ABQ5IHZ6_9ASTR